MNLILIRVKQNEEKGLNVPCLPELDKVVIMPECPVSRKRESTDSWSEIWNL